MRVCVIAEIGVNHNGQYEAAERLIDAAIAAGADAVKLQAFSAESLVSRDTPLASYQAEKTSYQDQNQMLSRLQLSVDELMRLGKYARSRETEFLLSIFDIEAIGWIVASGLVSRWKIPSGELTNLPLIEACAQTQIPMILSTGMASEEEVDVAVATVAKAHLEGTPEESRQCSQMQSREYELLARPSMLTLLHCTSEYPAAERNCNLRAISTMRQRYGLPVGYSDHTDGIFVSPLAVALGVEVVEKHITLDRSAQGPDHAASLDPGQFAQMVREIRRVEEIMGTGIKSPTAQEKRNARVVRKSVRAARDIREGEPFSESNLRITRPEAGLKPASIWVLYGKLAKSEYARGDLIRPEELE